MYSGATIFLHSSGLAFQTIKWELEDLSFAILHPKLYVEIESMVRERTPQREEFVQQVIDAVEQPATARDIPIDVAGTAFQEACWKALRDIPPGETRSYSEIAAAAGNPKAVRAAGSANGANNVAVLIPCHRVVRSDGSIGGYAYGTDIKEELLRREGEPG